jgi:alanine-synthesizing transaminase
MMEMQFSSLADDLGGQKKNPLYILLDELRARGTPIVDLIRGNVNEYGIVYPANVLAEILSRAVDASRVYSPDSFGQPVAREAVAGYYAKLKIPPSQILMTPGTSIAYWYCFKLLAESGDEILCPQPSYPLFDYIARLCGVRMTNYRLMESRDWSIDLEHLEQQISTRTRAIVLISPHNPTGMVADEQQLAGLAEIAERHGLPIISDEVFSEFLFGLDTLPRPAATKAPLVFTLNGFSKMFALPGIKLGWMAVSGDPALVQRSLSALEMMSDTLLPVNEIVQFSVPELFSHGNGFQKNYVEWVRQCFDKAMAGLADVDFVRPRGGFYVTLPVFEDEEEAATNLLRDHGILTHPGYYYDIEPNHLVSTFIHDPVSLTKSFRRIALAARMS